jgi:hypothetical protein
VGLVIPAEAGIQALDSPCSARDFWTPAFAGVTKCCSRDSDENFSTRHIQLKAFFALVCRTAHFTAAEKIVADCNKRLASFEKSRIGCADSSPGTAQSQGRQPFMSRRQRMKKFLVLTTLMAFMAAAPLAMAAKAKPVKCCIKGQCEEKATKADCTKVKGKVVTDCKKCK